MSCPRSIRHAQHPSCVLVLRPGVNARCFLCRNVCCNARYACQCNVNIHPQCAFARAGQVNVVQPGAQMQRRVRPAVNNSRGGYVNNGYAYNNNGNQGGYMTNNRQAGGYGNGYAGNNNNNNNGYQQGGYGNQYADAGQQMGGYGGGGGDDGGGFVEDVVDFVCEEGAWMAVDAVSTATIGAPISEFVRY